jgi:hypothetical protein
MHLKHDLGDWNRHDWDKWHWFYTPALDGLIQHVSTDVILLHHRRHSNLNQRIYSSSGKTLHSLLETLLKASVRQTRKKEWWLLDTGSVLTAEESIAPSTIEEHLLQSELTNRWCFKHLTIPTNYEALIGP